MVCSSSLIVILLEKLYSQAVKKRKITIGGVMIVAPLISLHKWKCIDIR